MSGKERIAGRDAWPPNPGDIDLSDSDWVTVSQAVGIARVTERTIRTWIATKDIALKVHGRVWISRSRLMAL